MLYTKYYCTLAFYHFTIIHQLQKRGPHAYNTNYIINILCESSLLASKHSHHSYHLHYSTRALPESLYYMPLGQIALCHLQHTCTY